MAMKSKSIRKVGLNPQLAAPPKKATKGTKAMAMAAPAPVVATLVMSVSKSGLGGTSVSVGSTGDDDREFTSQELAKGPVQMPILKGSFYAVLWRGGLTNGASARLKLTVTNAGGSVLVDKTVVAKRPPLGATFNLLVL